jgi:hypothetical protein
VDLVSPSSQHVTMENPKSYNCGAANSSNATQQMALPADR